jgi:MFS family permease
MEKLHAPQRHFFLAINPVIRYMMFSDFVWIGATELLVPIFALFIEETVVGGNAAVVGIAMSIYLVTKSVVQIFAASIIDRIKGERDDVWVLLSFSLASAFFPLAYLFMKTPVHLFFIQFVYGFLAGFVLPAFMAIFTRHVDKDQAAIEWSTYYSLIGLGAAFAAFAGGITAVLVGFKVLILISVSISVAGVLLLFPLRSYLLKR